MKKFYWGILAICCFYGCATTMPDNTLSLKEGEKNNFEELRVVEQILRDGYLDFQGSPSGKRVSFVKGLTSPVSREEKIDELKILECILRDGYVEEACLKEL